MTQLLQDVFIVENLQVLTEGKSSDTMKIKGVFGRCNEKNNNGRIYPTNVLEGQLNKVQPLISERRLCGELDHPQNDTVKLSNASHLITKLEMKGDELIGEAEILKTPAGLTAKALIEGGVCIGISSRGMGTLSEDAKGNKIVNEDFRLVTFDLVADPSTRGAFPGLSESTQSQFARESQSKLEKESNFVTMLQSKLREAYEPWIEEAKDKKKKGKGGPTDDDGATTDDSLDPVGQGDADMDNDGDTDASDKYLKNRRKAIGKAMKGKKKKKVMEAVKAEGSWHRIARALVSEEEGGGFAAMVDKTKVGDGKAAGGIKGDGPGFMARRRDRAGRISAAKADVKAAKIRQKGQIKLARKLQKTTAAADAGGPVTTGEKVVDAGRRAAGAARDAVSSKPSAEGQAASDRVKDRAKKDRDARLAAASSGGGAEGGPDPTKRSQQSADAQAQRAKDAERLRTLRGRGNAQGAKQAKTALAQNREKKFGKEAGEIGISAGTEYIRWGRMLAEMMTHERISAAQKSAFERKNKEVAQGIHTRGTGENERPAKKKSEIDKQANRVRSKLIDKRKEAGMRQFDDNK